MEAAVADGDEGGGDVTKAIGMELWLWWHVACGMWQLAMERIPLERRMFTVGF